MSAPPLRELQSLFWEAIASEPGEARPAPSLLRLVAPSEPLQSVDRVAIYAGMYWSRIVDVLRQDFAYTARALGDGVFEGLVREYLRARPSRHPSIAHVGEGFADFLATHLPAAAPPLAVDLARLEWARVQAFDAPDAEPLRLADLRDLPAEAWPDLSLTNVPSLAVVDLSWPVHRLLDSESADRLTAEPTVLRIWRRGYLVFHATVDATEQVALRRLSGDATFAEIADACNGAQEAAALLARWLEDELVTRPTGSTSSVEAVWVAERDVTTPS